jgi:hypothetical protein
MDKSDFINLLIPFAVIPLTGAHCILSLSFKVGSPQLLSTKASCYLQNLKSLIIPIVS